MKIKCFSLLWIESFYENGPKQPFMHLLWTSILNPLMPFNQKTFGNEAWELNVLQTELNRRIRNAFLLVR